MRRCVERVAAVAGQLAMIAVGAYLGLQAEQWRENRSKAALARATLRNFRDEIAANRAAIAAVQPYHARTSDGLHRVFNDQMRVERPINLIEVTTRSGFNGTNTADLQTTAYDLAVVTQALGELPSALAFHLSRVYTRQRALQTYANKFNYAMLGAIPSPRNDFARPLFMLESGTRDTPTQERRLTVEYDSTLPRLDSALARK